MATNKDVREMLGLPMGDGTPKPAAAKKARTSGQPQRLSLSPALQLLLQSQSTDINTLQRESTEKSSPSMATALHQSPSSSPESHIERSYNEASNQRTGTTYHSRIRRAQIDFALGTGGNRSPRDRRLPRTARKARTKTRKRSRKNTSSQSTTSKSRFPHIPMSSMRRI
jgi:hypothetical protein